MSKHGACGYRGRGVRTLVRHRFLFGSFESTDLSTFAPLTVNTDSVSVVDGSICLEFAPEDRAAFFRFSVE